MAGKKASRTSLNTFWKCEGEQPTVWKLRNFTLTQKISWNLILQALNSRNFCDEMVRVNFSNFHTVQPIAVFVRENHLLKQKIHLTLSHRKRSSVSGRSCISLKYFLKRVEKKGLKCAKRGLMCVMFRSAPFTCILSTYVCK